MLARKLSPTLIVSLIALVFAVSGIAIAAGPGGMFSKAQTKKVKKLARAEANKVIAKRAAKLSVASAANAANAASLGGLPSGAYAQAASEPWRVVGAPGQPPYLTGWSAYESGYPLPAFYKDPLGIVRLRGALSGPTNSEAFVLPPGYRPGDDVDVLAVDAAGPAVVDIDENGSVSLFCEAAFCSPTNLESVSFRAEG